MRDVSDRQVRGGALAGCPSANPEETLLVASVGVATDTIAKASRCSWTIEGAERFPPTCVQIRWSCAVGHSAGSCSLSKTGPLANSERSRAGIARLTASMSSEIPTEAHFRARPTVLFIPYAKCAVGRVSNEVSGHGSVYGPIAPTGITATPSGRRYP